MKTNMITCMLSSFDEIIYRLSLFLMSILEMLRFKRISLNVHMSENRINTNYRNRQTKNFGETNFMAANHSVLIHNYFLLLVRILHFMKLQDFNFSKVN